MPSRIIARIALFASMVAVATMVIHIPMPAVKGFINLGDSVIFVAAILSGPLVGGLAGAIGSAIADVSLGYAHWAPWTFVIKGIEGVIVGVLAAKPVIAMGGGALWMVSGYFVAASVMYGVAPATASIPGDALQGAASILIGWLVLRALPQRFR